MSPTFKSKRVSFGTKKFSVSTDVGDENERVYGKNSAAESSVFRTLVRRISSRRNRHGTADYCSMVF